MASTTALTALKSRRKPQSSALNPQFSFHPDQPDRLRPASLRIKRSKERKRTDTRPKVRAGKHLDAQLVRNLADDLNRVSDLEVAVLQELRHEAAPPRQLLFQNFALRIRDKQGDMNCSPKRNPVRVAR